MIAELRRAQVARLSLADLARAEVSASILLDEVQKRRQAGAASDEDVLELFEALLTREGAVSAAERGRYLREYVLLVAQLAARDAQLLEKKMRAGTVLACEEPQALAVVIGAMLRFSGKYADELQQLLAATCAKDPTVASAYALLLNNSPFAQLVADVWPAKSAGEEILLASLVNAEIDAQDDAAWQHRVQKALKIVVQSPDTPVAELAAERIMHSMPQHEPRWCDVVAWEMPALALQQLRSESSKYVLELSRVMHGFATTATGGRSLPRLIGLAFSAWPCVCLEFAGWQLHSPKVTLSQLWQTLTKSDLLATTGTEELQEQLLSIESHQWSSQFSSTSCLMFRYYFQMLCQKEPHAVEWELADVNNRGDWLESITSLTADEGLLWLMSALTLTCALASLADIPTWTTTEQIQHMLNDLLKATAQVVQSEPVQGVRVFPHFMFLANICTTTNQLAGAKVAHTLYQALPTIAGHKLSTKQVLQTLLSWINSGSEVHYPLGIEGIAKIAQLGPELTAQAVEQLNRIRPFYATQMNTTPFLQAVPVKIAWLNAVSELTKHVSDDDDATGFMNDVQLALKDPNANVGAAAVQCLKAFVDQDMVDLNAVYRIICKPSNTATLESNQVQVKLAVFCGYVEIKDDDSDEELDAEQSDHEPDPDAEMLKLREVYHLAIEHLIVAMEHSCTDVRQAAAASLAEYPARILAFQEGGLVFAVQQAVMSRFEQEEDSKVLKSSTQVAAKLVDFEIASRVHWHDARTADGRLQSSLRDTVSNKTIAAIPKHGKLHDMLKRTVSDAERQLLFPETVGEVSFGTLRQIVSQHDPSSRMRSDTVLLMNLVEYGQLLSGFVRNRAEELMSELRGTAGTSPAAIVNICDALTGLSLQLGQSAVTAEQCAQIHNSYRVCRDLLPRTTELRTEIIFSSAISASWLRCMVEGGYVVSEGDEMAQLFSSSVSNILQNLTNGEDSRTLFCTLLAGSAILKSIRHHNLPTSCASLVVELRRVVVVRLLQAIGATTCSIPQLQTCLDAIEPQLRTEDLQTSVAAGTSLAFAVPLGVVLAMEAWLSATQDAAPNHAVMRLVDAIVAESQLEAAQRQTLVILSPVLFHHCQAVGAAPAPETTRYLLNAGAELVTSAMEQSREVDPALFNDSACALTWQFGSLLRFASGHSAVVWETLTKGVSLLLRAASTAAAVAGSGRQTGALLGLSAAVSPITDGYLSSSFYDASDLFSSRLLDRVLLESILPVQTAWLEDAGAPALAKLFAARAWVAIGKLQQGPSGSAGAGQSNRYLGSVPVASVLVPAQQAMLATVLGGVTQVLIGQHMQSAEEQRHRVSYVASCLQALARAELREGFHSASLCDALIASGAAVDARAWLAAFDFASHHFSRSQDPHYASTMRRICGLTRNTSVEMEPELVFSMATHLPSMCRSLSVQQSSELVLAVLDRVVMAPVISVATLLQFLQTIGHLLGEATNAATRAELEQNIVFVAIHKIAERALANLTPSSYIRVLHAVAEFGKCLQAPTVNTLADGLPCNSRYDSWVGLALLTTQSVQVQRRWLRRWVSTAVIQGAVAAVSGFSEAIRFCEWSADDQLGVVTDAFLAAEEAVSTKANSQLDAISACLIHLTAVVLSAQLVDLRNRAVPLSAAQPAREAIAIWPRAQFVPQEQLEQIASSVCALPVQLRSFLALVSQAIEWRSKSGADAQRSEDTVLVTLCRALHQLLAKSAASADQSRVLAEISKFVLLASSRHRLGTVA